MNYNSLGAFLEKNADKLLPKKDDFRPIKFLSEEQEDTIENINWVIYCNNWQSMLKAVLNNFCSDLWGEDFSIQMLLLGDKKKSGELSIWVVSTPNRGVVNS